MLFTGNDKDSIFSLVVGKKLKTIGLTEVHLVKVEVINKATFLFLWLQAEHWNENRPDKVTSMILKQVAKEK